MVMVWPIRVHRKNGSPHVRFPYRDDEDRTLLVEEVTPPDKPKKPSRLATKAQNGEDTKRVQCSRQKNGQWRKRLLCAKMRTIRDTLAEGTEGVNQLGPEQARFYSDLSPEDKDRYNADIPDDYDAFDFDVDEAPTAQTMFIENLSSTDLVYDEAGLSYDSDILSETDYASDSNMILYDQYVKDNTVSVVQSNVSSIQNDAYMMIINEMHEQATHCAFMNEQNKVVSVSLTAELATYKEQVELYERRVKFELTEREQKIEEQLRIVITERNIKEEN
ncbi:hypothetical protein Tco_0722360 [Tanacetum coccineum]